jgi:hypothetical protein
MSSLNRKATCGGGGKPLHRAPRAALAQGGRDDEASELTATLTPTLAGKLLDNGQRSIRLNPP